MEEVLLSQSDCHLVCGDGIDRVTAVGGCVFVSRYLSGQLASVGGLAGGPGQGVS